MPLDWDSLPLYQKIGIEGPRLNAEHRDYLNKIKAKEIVAGIAPTAPLVRTFLKPTDFTEKDINAAHILKASCGSGLLLDLAKVQSVMAARTAMAHWATQLRRRKDPIEYLIEEKIVDAVYGVTGNAVDYKFFCFNGEPAFFLCQHDHGNYRNYFNLDYTPIKLSSVQLPEIDLTEMIRVARTLSKPFPFVRIDLYNTIDGVYFGEFTFYANAGSQRFDMTKELEVGKLWTQPPQPLKKVKAP